MIVIIEELKTNVLFKGIGIGELHNLLKDYNLKVYAYKKDEIIVLEGEVSEGIGIVLEGEIGR